MATRAPAPRDSIGEQAAVFVVGVGDDVHQGGAGAELEEELLEGGGAVVEGEGVGGGLRGRPARR